MSVKQQILHTPLCRFGTFALDIRHELALGPTAMSRVHELVLVLIRISEIPNPNTSMQDSIPDCPAFWLFDGPTYWPIEP